MSMMETIAKRQSCRAYTGDQITDAQLTVLLQAANAAPVGMARFSDVKLTVIQNKALLEKLDANAAQVMQQPGLHPTYGAPTLILVSGKIVKGPMSSLPFCNCSCVMENMLLAATNLGLGCVYLLGVVNAAKQNSSLMAELKVPEGFLPVAAMAVGTPAAPLTDRVLTTDKLAIDYIR